MMMLLLGIAVLVVGYGAWTWVTDLGMGRNQTWQPPNPEGVRSALVRLQQSDQTLLTLSVTYHDLHGFHGGLILTIHGDGRVSQEAVRVKVGPLKERVAKEDLRRLVDLLIELSAWQQLVADAMPIPDESRASVRISLEGHQSVIWERYNDLAAGQRIIRIRELLKQIAWQSAP